MRHGYFIGLKLGREWPKLDGDPVCFNRCHGSAHMGSWLTFNKGLNSELNM
jgi:hypothetical protein